MQLRGQRSVRKVEDAVADYHSKEARSAQPPAPSNLISSIHHAYNSHSAQPAPLHSSGPTASASGPPAGGYGPGTSGYGPGASGFGPSSASGFGPAASGGASGLAGGSGSLDPASA
eukprot:CAMPEP_0181312204 /NCGR_PEP_ID=MMETSP1101-20121128/13568_1 /TAXON_ID=46948 /ORGANISM="Rhodomonas abbreviata, Strain Caron Lab Isolate" /LENGTH=115 /DNA_ID=CAMNT_0023419031 /DNA_START=91 /DNA_END=435 /DNA_ORIENTATION=-